MMLDYENDAWNGPGWDEFISAGERKRISGLKLEDSDLACPFLRRKGKCFYYCEVLSDNYALEGFLTVDDTPNFYSPELHARRFFETIRDLCARCSEGCSLFQEGKLREEEMERIRNEEKESKNNGDN